MSSADICNADSAECERLLSNNVVQAQIYGSKDPVCVECRLFQGYNLLVCLVVCFGTVFLLFAFLFIAMMLISK